MARPVAVAIPGLQEFQRQLARAGAQWVKALRAENKAASTLVADSGKKKLKASGHPVLRHVAGLNAIRAKSDARAAKVIVSALAKRNAMALGAELGSKQYRQFPEYREAAWRQGLPTGGYGVLEAIRQDIDEIREGYGDRIERLYWRAFPK
jgi:phosphoribosyl-AMP cyclohydrolase